MYVYCDKCRWTQDDFWDENDYNPFISLTTRYQKKLFDTKNIDAVFYVDGRDTFGRFIGQKPTTIREIMAEQFENFAKKIRNQRYITYKQYLEENPREECPICRNDLNTD